jgi:K+-transporting ATPase ATPase A chain
MHANEWLQLAIFVAAVALVTKPMGLYLVRVLDANGKTWLDPVFKPLERLTYWVMGVHPDREQDWKQYTFAMLLFSLVSCLFTYAILRLQQWLPLNPQGFGALSPDLAFNTSTSFTTNTNWQSYTGESTMSYFSQMVGLVIHNFTSAATGIALAAALVRGIARHTATTLGNFWVDLVRITYYLLLPICIVFATFLVSQGIIQNFKGYTQAKLTEPYTIQVQKTDDKGQPVTTNVAVTVQVPKLDAQGRAVLTNGVAVMVEAPKLDDKGQPMMTNVPVMVDQKVEQQSRDRWRRKLPSRCWAPTAAAFSTPTPRIRSRIPRRSPTSSRCCPFSRLAAG